MDWTQIQGVDKRLDFGKPKFLFLTLLLLLASFILIGMKGCPWLPPYEPPEPSPLEKRLKLYKQYAKYLEPDNWPDIAIDQIIFSTTLEAMAGWLGDLIEIYEVAAKYYGKAKTFTEAASKVVDSKFTPAYISCIFQHLGDPLDHPYDLDDKLIQNRFLKARDYIKQGLPNKAGPSLDELEKMLQWMKNNFSGAVSECEPLMNKEAEETAKNLINSGLNFVRAEQALIGSSEVYSITFAESPRVSPIIIDGTTYTTNKLPITKIWKEDTTHSFSVYSSVDLLSGKTYQFDHWSDGSTSNVRTITVTEDKTYIAVYKEKKLTYDITFDEDPRVSPLTIDGATYSENQLPISKTWGEDTSHSFSVEKTVTSGEDQYEFDRWNNGDTSPSRTITVTEDQTYTAYYTKMDGNHDCHTGSPGDWKYCSVGCKCSAGKGDCDSDKECESDLICKVNAGDKYGWNKEVDVCEKPDGNHDCHTGSPGDWKYCSVGCKCSAGKGDCDANNECEGDLICKTNAGDKYGWNKEVDVCEKPE